MSPPRLGDSDEPSPDFPEFATVSVLERDGQYRLGLELRGRRCLGSEIFDNEAEAIASLYDMALELDGDAGPPN
jgi:hypothetical protein